MSRPILVTGATGFAGSHLVDLLAQEPGSVVGTYRQRSPEQASDPVRDARVSWRQLDLLDREAVRRAVAEIHPASVYHLAGWAPVGRSWRHATQAYETNVMGTHHLLEALREQHVRARVLVSGSAYVYESSPRRLTEDSPVHPESPYAVSKLAQEMRARQAADDDEQPVIVTRSFNHLGPRQAPAFAGPSFARQLARIEQGLEPPVIKVGNLETRRDFTDVRDVVRAYRQLMDVGGDGIYNVCSGHGRTIRELLDGLLAHASVTVRVEVDRDRLRPTDVSSLIGDPGRLQSATGWRPHVAFDTTLHDILEDWRHRVSA